MHSSGDFMPGTSTLERAASRAPSAVKDAYAAWLSQLDGDDAADKVLATLQPRRQHRSRAERVAQIEHAQQSTTTSSLKRSAVAVAVDSDCVIGTSQNDADGVGLPAIEIDKTMSRQRRHQALVDQASYANLKTYTPDLSPGLAFLVSLADAADAGAAPFRSASPTAFDTSASPTDGALVRDYELPNFPVRIVPTLLRVRSSPQSQDRRLKEPIRRRQWFMALLLCRDLSESDDDNSLPSAPRGVVPPSRTPGQSSRAQAGVPSTLTLHVRLYHVPLPRSELSKTSAIPSESRRALVRMLLSSWLSTSGTGYYGGGVRAVCKNRVLRSDGGTSRPLASEFRLLRTAEEVEKAVDALCGDSATHGSVSGVSRRVIGSRSMHESNRLNREEDNNARDENDATEDDSVHAIQPYIPSRSSLHATITSGGSSFAPERSAWIARCSFRKKEKNPSTIWILSGGGELANPASSGEQVVAITVDEQSESCQIVKCVSSQSWTEPRMLTATLAPELERILRVSFKELVADFLQGSDGTWLLLQIKAFDLRKQDRAVGLSADGETRRTKSAPDRLTAALAFPAQRYRKWRCAGRFCNTSFSPGEMSPLAVDSNSEPSGYLSLKVVRSCEFVDDYYCRRDVSLVGGFENFSTALAFNLQHELPKREARQLYESQPLCSACIRRYYQLREQLEETVARETKADAVLGGRSSSMTMAKAKGSRHTASTGRLNPARPRVLPALPADKAGMTAIAASVSAPDLIPAPRERTKSSIRKADVPQRSCLDEIADMERMLALSSESSLTTTETQQFTRGDLEPQTTTTDTGGRIDLGTKGDSSSSDVYTRIFSPDGQRRRVEAMWQSAAPKSLAHNPVQQPQRQQQDCTEKMYNTFSLSSELQRLERDTAEAELAPPVITKSTDMNVHQSSASSSRPQASQKTHHIRLSDCRSVFSDDDYRDRLVQEAIDAIVDRGERVCFIVMASSEGEEADAQLPDIALRSLFLDVKDGVARSPGNRAMTSTPQVLHEASGCATMTI